MAFAEKPQCNIAETVTSKVSEVLTADSKVFARRQCRHCQSKTETTRTERKQIRRSKPLIQAQTIIEYRRFAVTGNRQFFGF